MRISIDAEAVLYAFSGENQEFEDILRPSIIGINDTIIDDYTQKIIQEASGLGKDWLTRIYSNPNRLCLIDNQSLLHYGLDSENLCDSYIGAAYFNGHKLVTLQEGTPRTEKARTYGIKIISPADIPDIALMDGHAIIYNLQLNAKTNYKHVAIRNFFEKELDILIYDKFIKESSLCLFENILRQCNPHATIILISEFDSNGKSPISKQEAERRLKAIRPHATVKCYYPASFGNDDEHDRHIHLGSRLQMSFSRGTDCFGLNPNWHNSECDISVYYLCNESANRTYYVSDKPHKPGRGITVKSKI